VNFRLEAVLASGPTEGDANSGTADRAHRRHRAETVGDWAATLEYVLDDAPETKCVCRPLATPPLCGGYKSSSSVKARKLTLVHENNRMYGRCIQAPMRELIMKLTTETEAPLKKVRPPPYPPHKHVSRRGRVAHRLLSSCCAVAQEPLQMLTEQATMTPPAGEAAAVAVCRPPTPQSAACQ
jgi:hypothetical protein